VGFDDCEHTRKWSSSEINLLQNTANILVSLLVRRNTETETARTLNILQTITDNMDSIIYVNDVKTHELVFMNKALTDSLELEQQEPLGQFCWQTLQKARSGPCSFCPMNQMLDNQYNVVKTPLIWEFQSTKTGKWYLIKDDIIKWIDGRDVHIETATEITSQKIYEQELQQYATFDMMTGAYNREWGSRQLQGLLSNRHALETQNNSLVFIDINDLKLVNDTYGHDVGDDLIRETVSIIRSCVRKVDVLCRWGGDEFVLILQCGEDTARRIMGDVCKKMDDISADGRKQYRLSISYGITPLDTSSTNLETVIARADHLMYESKMQYKAPNEQ
jgi:diguanylate cyclase (GGDEF)-like protein